MSCVYAVAIILEHRTNHSVAIRSACLVEDTPQAALGTAVAKALEDNPGFCVLGYDWQPLEYDGLALILSEQEDS